MKQTKTALKNTYEIWLAPFADGAMTKAFANLQTSRLFSAVLRRRAKSRKDKNSDQNTTDRVESGD